VWARAIFTAFSSGFGAGGEEGSLLGPADRHQLVDALGQRTTLSYGTIW
jgi:hypothetical protein